MKKIIPIMILVSLCTVSLFAQGKLNKSFSGIKKIRINTSSGDCKIVKGSGANVVVDLQHTFGTSYKPEVTQEGDRLNIKEVFSNGSHSGNAKWTITIPDGIDLKFSTGSGSLDAAGLSFNLDINTGSGDIRLSQITGDVKGITGSGEIDISNFNGTIKATTGSGNIDVEQSKGEITINCGSGDIGIYNSEASFAATTGSGAIRSRSVSLQGDSRFASGSGDARIVLAAAPKYNIAINSGSGDAELDFNGNKIEGEVVMKANKRNGTISAPFEFDKIEEVEQGGDQVTVKKTAVKGNANIKISVGTGSGAAVIK